MHEKGFFVAGLPCYLSYFKKAPYFLFIQNNSQTANAVRHSTVLKGTFLFFLVWFIKKTELRSLPQEGSVLSERAPACVGRNTPETVYIM